MILDLLDWQLIDKTFWLPLMALWYYVSKFGYTFYIHRYVWHNQYEIHPTFLKAVKIWIWLNFPQIWIKDYHYFTKLLHVKHHLTADTDDDPQTPLKFTLKDYIFQTNNIYALSQEDYIRYGLKYKIKRSNTEPRDKLSLFLFKYNNLGVAITTLIWTVITGWPGILFGIFYKFINQHFIAVSIDMYAHKGIGYKHPLDKSYAVQRNPWPFTEGLHSNHHANFNKIDTRYRWFEIDFYYLQIKFLALLGLVKINEKAKTEN